MTVLDFTNMWPKFKTKNIRYARLALIWKLIQLRNVQKTNQLK